MATIPEALAIAIQHHQGGRLQTAEQIYRQILQADPHQADALHLLGVIAHQAGNHETAAEYIGHAIRSNGKAASYHNNLARVNQALGRLTEALAAGRRALELQPDFAEAELNLGSIYMDQRDPGEAAACFRKAIKLRPRLTAAHINLGIALIEQRMPVEAIASFRQAVALEPSFAGAHANLGNALRHEGRLEEAIGCLQRAIALDPRIPKAHANLGAALMEIGKLDEATSCFRQTLELEPQFAGAEFCLAIALLLQGQLEEGFARYEARLALYPPRALSAPRWNREPIEGKSILLHCEQGLGDSIHFLRYARLVRERTKAGRVILECPPKLARLLAQSVGDEMEIVAGVDEHAAPARCDRHLPLLSVPWALGLFEPLPMDGPYLRADSRLRALWQERLGERGKLRVGLAWRGNPEQASDHVRSVLAEQFLPLLKIDGAEFYNLQIDALAGEAAMLAEAGLIDHTAHVSDFADTAALVAELDLVIAVDTAVVHLAGALGRPVWSLLPFVPHWPWGMNGEATPWYATMRLFRQPRAGDWDLVFRRVEAELKVSVRAVR